MKRTTLLLGLLLALCSTDAQCETATSGNSPGVYASHIVAFMKFKAAQDTPVLKHKVSVARRRKRSMTDSATTPTAGVKGRQPRPGKRVRPGDISTKTMVMVWGLLLTLPMFWHERKRKRINRELDKYEFEHRTGGGVVQFKTFEDAEKHNRRRSRAHASSIQGLVPGCLGMIGLMMIVGGMFFL
jgi:hypothetical protein